MKLTIEERIHQFIFKSVYNLLRKVPDQLGHTACVWWTNAAPKVVCCERCGTKYRQAFLGSKDFTQGVDCAAEIFKSDGVWLLQCYYGSSYDTNLYKFVKEPFEYLKDLPVICDTCITSLLERKLIKLYYEDVIWTQR